MTLNLIAAYFSAGDWKQEPLKGMPSLIMFRYKSSQVRVAITLASMTKDIEEENSSDIVVIFRRPDDKANMVFGMPRNEVDILLPSVLNVALQDSKKRAISHGVYLTELEKWYKQWFPASQEASNSSTLPSSTKTTPLSQSTQITQLATPPAAIDK